MSDPEKKKWTVSFAAAQASRYAFALGGILIAFGLAHLSMHFHLPQPFTALALCAIAITFWYGGTGPGIFAALLSALIRPFFFEPGVNAISHLLYDFVFLIFAVLMTYATRARHELELMITERTSALTQANEDLRLEIAEHACAEEKLRQTEAYLSEAQRLTRMGSWVWSVKGRDALHLSEEWYRIYGFDPQLGVPTWEDRLQRIHPKDRDKWLTAIDQAVASKSDYEVEFRILLPAGTVRHIYTVGHPVMTASGELVQFVGSSTDVTERKLAEESLRRSEAYLAEGQRLTQTGSWAANIITRELLHSSEEHSRLYGFDPNQGTPSFDQVYQRIHPEDRERALATFEIASRNGTDGELEFRVVLPDGTTRHLHVIGHPVVKLSGETGEFVGITMDVTERKRADQQREILRQAHADLAHITRVTTMGELTASLAHEINQPIAAAVTDASTCLRWLTRDQPNLEEARAAASRIVKDATRAAEIISRIRLLFKKGTPEHTLVDLNEIIREMIVLLRNELTRHSISVREDLAENIPETMGDRVQLQQVIMNLILNSIDAMNEVGGTRELAIKSQRGDNEQVMVSVSDTGIGLPGQRAEQIFDPFFSTKQHGTGMGLRISRSIIEAHGGRLWAENNSPRGASFTLTLPIKVEAHELLASSSFSE